MLSRYRWLVLAAGTAAQTSFSAVIIGLPVLAPALRDEHSLSLLQVGVVLDSLWIGTLVTLLPWGLLADRRGERLVLATGLTLCAGALVAAGSAAGFWALIALIFLAGAAGASVPPAFAAVVAASSWRIGFAGAAFGVAVIRDRQGHTEDDVLEPRGLGATLRDHRLWLLCTGSSFYLVAQLALISFLVLFLHDERGLSGAAAAGVLGGAQVVAAGMRIGSGIWSDRIGSRIRPLLLVGLGSSITLAVVAAALSAPLVVLIPAMVVAGGLSMAWNGLSFTAAAEIAGRSRSGAALGMQQSALAAAGAIVPPAFAAVVAASSWRIGFAGAAVFPLAGVLLLRPLRA